LGSSNAFVLTAGCVKYIALSPRLKAKPSVADEISEVHEGLIMIGKTRPVGVRISIEQLWLAAPVLVFLCNSFRFPVPLLDFWWHLKMGEVIATTKSIPRVDIFSFTATGQTFVAQNWLAEVIFYWTYKVGGLPLIVFFTSILSLTGFLLIYRLCLNATNKMRLCAFLGLLAALGNYSLSRPQAFSFALFAAFYFVLVHYRERRQDLLWCLPVLMALWVNLHGAFVLGLGLIVLYIACEGCRRLIDPSRTDALTFTEIRKLFLVLLACGAATLMNPETYNVYDYVRTVVSDPASQKFVIEWQPPRINNFIGVLLFFAPLFVGLLAFIFARRKPDLTETALFFAFGILGLSAIRNVGWFAAVAYPILARYLPLVDLSPLFPLRRFRGVDGLLGWMERSDVAPAEGHNRLNILLVSVALLTLVVQSPWMRPALKKTSLTDAATPVGAVNFIEQHQLTGHIFHPQVFGDYLIWRLWPQQKSFIDGRVHLFSEDFCRQSLGLLSDSDWEKVLNRWDIQYMLLNKVSADSATMNAIASSRNSSRWTKLYEDDISILFEKNLAVSSL
jgi:hypothetical protein